jgi:hypothetical protein
VNKLLLLFCIPFLSVGQNFDKAISLHLREIPKHNVSTDLGIVQPINEYGDVARSGLSVAVAYDYYFNKTIGLSIAGKHVYNQTALESREPTDDNSLTSLTAGFVASKTFNRFQLDAFARLGMGYLITNSGDGISQNNSQIYSTNDDEMKDVPLVIDIGMRFNYYFRRSVQLYFSPQYNSSLGNALVYDNQPYLYDPNDSSFEMRKQPSFDFSNLLFSLGVKFAIGPKYTNDELRDDSELDN